MYSRNILSKFNRHNNFGILKYIPSEKRLEAKTVFKGLSFGKVNSVKVP